MLLFSIAALNCNCAKKQIDADEAGKLSAGIDLSLSEGVQLIEFQKGRKLWKINSQEANYAAGTGILNIAGVEGHYFKDEKEVCEVRGKRGVYSSDDKTFELFDGVNIRNLDGYILKTNSMKYLLDQEIAITNSQIEITGSGLKITGDGLRVSVKDNTLEVHRNVRIIITPGKIREMEKKRGQK